MGFWKHAFAIDEKAEYAFTDEEKELIRRLADKIVGYGLAIPGLLFIESARPLNFVGAQALAWFEPIVKSLFSWRDYEKFRLVLERRGSVDLILKAIEEAEGKRSAEIAEFKAQKRPGLITRTIRRLRKSPEKGCAAPESEKQSANCADKESQKEANR